MVLQSGWGTVVGSGLFGAGSNGLVNDVTALASHGGAEEPDKASWGISLAIGLIFGLLEGGLSLKMAPLLTKLGTTAISKGNIVGNAATKFSIPMSRPILTQTLNTGLKNGISVGTSALLGAAGSFTETMITNRKRGNGLLDGVGRSIWLGAVL